MPRTVAKRISRPLGPPHGQAHRLGHAHFICGQGRTFVETHHNVRPQQFLDFHRPFRRQEVTRPIHMGFERHAILGQLAQIRQGHHLKPARVRQNRLIPVHELVQTAQSVDPLRRGAQHQVIGIAQQNIGTGCGNAFGHHRLDGCCGPNRHKRWRPNITPRGVNDTGPCLSVCCF